MTIPPLELVKRLGPNFDFTSLDRLAESPSFGSLPADAQANIKAVRQLGVHLKEVNTSAPVDHIGQGAIATPPHQENNFNLVDASVAVGEGMSNMFPGTFLQSTMMQMARAFVNSKATGQTFEDSFHKEAFQANLATQEFYHQFSAGLVKSPDVPKEFQDNFNTIVKPVVSMAAMGLQGIGVDKAIGLISKVPVAANLIENLPQRLIDVGAGAATFGVTDALRAEGIPTDPSVLDPSGRVAQKLSAAGVPDRIALFVGGAAVGGSLGGAFLGIQRGVEWGRAANIARQMSPDDMKSMRTALAALGVDVTNAPKAAVVNQYVKALKKVTMDESLANLTSQQLSREEYAMQALYGSTLGTDPAAAIGSANIAQDSEEARYLTGLMRGHPGAMSVATNITNPSQVYTAAEKLGLQVDIVAINRGNHPPEFTRLYRTETNAAKEAGQQGPQVNGLMDAIPGPRHFTDKLDYAKIYKGDSQTYLDVPNEHMDKFPKMEAEPGTGANIYLLPEEMASKRLPHNDNVPALEGPPIYDVLISRPDYKYPTFDNLSRQTKQATGKIQELAKSKTRDVFHAATNDMFVLADGSVIRGGLGIDEMATKIKVQAPIIDGEPRPDIGLKSVTQMLNISMLSDGQLQIDLPHALSQEQFNAIGPAVNVSRFSKVVIKTADGQVKMLEGPVGQQVQDAVAKLVAPASMESRLNPVKISQYKRTGVFEGQAAVLPDGSPVTIEAKAGDKVQVLDNFAGKSFAVHESKLTILPTSMEGEMAPSNLFYQYLSEEEQKKFAMLRLGMQQGLDKPLTNYRELKDFANARGFTVTQTPGQGYQLARITDGEAVTAKNVKTASAYLRKYNAPVPDLTPDVVRKVLGGDVGAGFLFPQGPPPDFGELMPVPTHIVSKAMQATAGGRGPGAFQLALTPTRGLTLDLDKRFGTQFYPLFANIQERSVQSQRFQATWFHGIGGDLPAGVMPLSKIQKLAGDAPNWENVTKWLETPEAQKAEFEKTISDGERKAAPEFRKWYHALFTNLGIEANYVEDYAPRIRQAAQTNGNNPKQLYNTVLANDPLKPSKALDFWADNYRTGSLDLYDRDALRVAQRYLSQGAQNRFLKEPLSQASQYVAKMAANNKSLAYPMGYFLQAVKGTEFSEQRVALSETFQSLIDNLPGTVPQKQVTDWADKASTFWMGSVYTSTQGLRPGLAVRNVASQLAMSWPLYGGNKGRFLEAMGSALTRNGMEQAIADGAISLQKNMRFDPAGQLGSLGAQWDKMVEAGFSMYDSAENFNRANVYWAARYKAEDAITNFVKKAPGLTGDALEKARKGLVVDSGLALQDPQVVNEFMRRMAISPEVASRYAGKQASDVVNFLYGRGMQPRWMRGIQGKLLGQFGTWSLWYIDYLRRTTTNLAANAGNAAAAGFLAKHALVNAAIAYTGSKVLNVNLGSWMVYPSVFYSGGPGFQVAEGLSTLARGMTSMSSGSDDPYGPAKVAGGVQMLNSTLPSMIPFFYAARDVVRFGQADDGTERLAAALATQPTREYSMDKRLAMVLGQPVESFSSSSPVVSALANSAAEGKFVGVDPMKVFAPAPPGAAPATGQTPQATQPQGMPRPTPVPRPQPISSIPNTGPANPLTKLEVRTSAESRPPQSF